MTLEVLNSFKGNAKVSIQDLTSGLQIINVESDLATASISLFGAQVLTWQPKSEDMPVFWTSPLAKYDGKTAIRGGVPICWPWFGKHPVESTAPSHGYVRLCVWELDGITSLEDGCVELVMSLPRSAQVGSSRLPGLDLSARIVIGTTLEVSLTTRNRSADSVPVTEGLHTYFHVSDVENVQVVGLEGCEYVDLTAGNQRQQQVKLINFQGEVGRIFTNCDKPTVIEDRAFGRAIHIAGLGSSSIAVWNPGMETASKMADLGCEGWRNMVCVETANALENAVIVEPQQEHSLSAIYSVSPL